MRTPTQATMRVRARAQSSSMLGRSKLRQRRFGLTEAWQTRHDGRTGLSRQLAVIRLVSCQSTSITSTTGSIDRTFQFSWKAHSVKARTEHE